MTVEYGKFDMTLLYSPQTESGRHLGGEAEVLGVMAKCLFVVAQTPVRQALLGSANNMARMMSTVDEAGLLPCWGAPGIANFHFRAPRVVSYFANVAGENVLARWADTPAVNGLDAALKDACNRHVFHDLNSYMSFIYQAAEGEETLGDFASEAAALLRAQKIKARDLEARLEKFGKGFRMRLGRVVAASRGRAGLAASAFTADVRDQAVILVDRDGAMSGSRLIGLAMDFLSGLRDELEGQRESIARDVELMEAAMAGGAAVLKAAVARSRTGRLSGVRKPLEGYLAAAKQHLQARHGLEVTTIALEAISTARMNLAALLHQIDGLRASMKAAAKLCGDRRREFESTPVTPVSEMIDRPVYDGADLKALYRWACGAEWAELTNETQAAIHRQIGGLSAWLGVDLDDIAAAFIDGCAPAFDGVRKMTADGFVRWSRDVLGKNPALFLRDAAALASPLARFDRTAARSDEHDEGTLTILGVTSREDSVFAATPLTTLVSTGDAQSISLVVLKLGYTANALWHYQDYVDANARIRKQGNVAHRIYPGFPSLETGPRRPKRRRPASRKRK